MITPLFKASQDENFIFLTIQIKYVKLSDVDFFIEKNNFKFYLKPYFLNLFFSDNLISESEKNHSTYDVDKGCLECKIEKENPGLHFENLDLLSTLMLNEKNNEKNILKKILVVNEENDSVVNLKINLPSIKDEESLNNYLLSKLMNITNQFNGLSLSSNDSTCVFSYGFNNEFNDVFKNREEEMMEMIDLNPGTVKRNHRYFSKMERENSDFVPERYFCDMNLEDDTEDDLFQSTIKFSLSKYFDKHITKSTPFEYSEKEINTLKSLNKIKLSLLDLESNIYFEFYLQIVDILFAFIFDMRLTQFEHNSESGWTINKLSAVLSNLVDFKDIFYSFSEIPPLNILEESLKNCLISSYRRILCYPLYRNLKLCNLIKDDISLILSKENNVFFILKFMLRIRSIFENCEPRHILNTIFIDNFILWIQFYSNKDIWLILSKLIKRIDISKNDIKLDLEEIENTILSDM